MNRREFFTKIGISTIVLAVMSPEMLRKTVNLTEKDKLKLDQDNLDLIKSIDLEISGNIYEVPIYIME